jgi:biopolymer transport protein ExbD
MELASPAAKKRARIEIIPLIDIIFFLLATFVMVSLSMVKQRGLSVNLPAASTASAEQLGNEDVTLTVKPGGMLFWNKEPTDLTDIQGRLARHHAEFPEAKLSINGDAEARLGDALALLDLARQTGVTKVQFQTRPVAGTPPPSNQPVKTE